MHVFVSQPAESRIVFLSLIIHRFPAAVFHLGSQRIQAGTGLTSQPVQIKAEGIYIINYIVIAGIILNHPDIDNITACRFYPISPQHIMPKGLIKIQSIISQRLLAALQIGNTGDTHTVKLRGTFHIAYSGGRSRIVDSAGKLHIHGIRIT